MLKIFKIEGVLIQSYFEFIGLTPGLGKRK